MKLNLQASAPYFEDLTVGTTFDTNGITLTEDAIIQYALMYDPQPFHVDRSAGRKAIFGALVASGFQVLALSFRAVCDTQVLTNNLGGNQADDLKWSKPVLPNDTLKVTGEVVDARDSASKADRGVLKIKYTTTNDKDEEVCRFTLTHIYRRRNLRS